MREGRHTGLRNPLIDSLCWILAIIATLIFIFPLYWAVSTSLRNPADTFTVAGIGIPFIDFAPTLISAPNSARPRACARCAPASSSRSAPRCWR